LIARWPGKIRPGQLSDHISAFCDMLPTLCDVAGAAVPAKIDGISFLPTLLGTGRQTPHEFLLWEFYGYSGQQAVRMGDWKGIRLNCHKDPKGPIKLYDLKNDIGETRDVAAEHPDIVERIAQIMTREHTDSPIFKFGAARKAKPAKARKPSP